jgi:hypothetical protein
MPWAEGGTPVTIERLFGFVKLGTMQSASRSARLEGPIRGRASRQLAPPADGSRARSRRCTPRRRAAGAKRSDDHGPEPSRRTSRWPHHAPSDWRGIKLRELGNGFACPLGSRCTYQMPVSENFPGYLFRVSVKPYCTLAPKAAIRDALALTRRVAPTLHSLARHLATPTGHR